MELREKGCQMGLFPLVVVEFAIVFDVVIHVAVTCHIRAMGNW